jgi:hypothetical protein
MKGIVHFIEAADRKSIEGAIREFERKILESPIGVRFKASVIGPISAYKDASS